MVHHLPWKKVEFAVIDFETTGQHSNKPGVCEIGGVAILDGSVSQLAYTTLINPEEESTDWAYRTHKITRERVRNEVTFSEQADYFEMFLKDRVLVAHAPSTEEKCIRKSMPGFKPRLVLDTCKLARHFRKERNGNKLRSLISEFQLRERINQDFNSRIGRSRRFHTAYYDALATAHLFTELVQRQFSEKSTLNEIAKVCQYSWKH